MPETPIHSLPYPGLLDPPAGPAQLQALAEAVETAIATRVTLTDGVTAEAGWDVSWFEAVAVGPWCMMRLAFNRTGSDITASADGNITDQTLGTIPADIIPALPLSGVCMGDGFHAGEGTIDGAGIVKLRCWSNSAVITAGRNIAMAATYLLP